MPVEIIIFFTLTIGKKFLVHAKVLFTIFLAEIALLKKILYLSLSFMEISLLKKRKIPCIRLKSRCFIKREVNKEI